MDKTRRLSQDLDDLILWSHSIVLVGVEGPDGDTAVVGIKTNELLADILDFVILTKKSDVLVHGRFGGLPTTPSAWLPSKT